VRGGPGLAELLRELGRLEGLRWMRLLYCYPSYFTEELIEEIATNPKARAAAALPRRGCRCPGRRAGCRPRRALTQSFASGCGAVQAGWGLMFGCDVGMQTLPHTCRATARAVRLHACSSAAGRRARTECGNAAWSMPCCAGGPLQ